MGSALTAVVFITLMSVLNVGKTTILRHTK